MMGVLLQAMKPASGFYQIPFVEWSLLYFDLGFSGFCPSSPTEHIYALYRQWHVAWLAISNYLNQMMNKFTNAYVCHQAPVPLTIFRSNSKFDQNLPCSGFKCTRPITTTFCTRHDSVTVVTCAKFRCDPIAVIGWACFQLEHFNF